jgi:DNA-directed RNA polymerase sigma subunit (sigma70/sigma32)
MEQRERKIIMKKETKVAPGSLECLIKTVYIDKEDVNPTFVLAEIGKLSPRQRDILYLHFGLGDGVPHPIGAVAKMLGLTPKRTLTQYAQIIRNLRHPTRYHEMLKERNED